MLGDGNGNVDSGGLNRKEEAYMCASGCLAAVSKAADLRRRRCWDAILPALSATIVARSNGSALSSTVTETTTTSTAAAVAGSLGVKDALNVLINLHRKAGDAFPASREVVAAATGIVVDGMRAEAFLSEVSIRYNRE